MNRRSLLTATVVASGLASTGVSATEISPPDFAAALARFRATIPSNFSREYVDHVVIPFFLTSFYEGERPNLPMIDVTLTKENALPFDLWGLLYEDWKPTPAAGVTVFLQGLEERGDNNLRKRIYMSAVTPDLYGPKYQGKVTDFFDKLLDARFAGKPFMRHYLNSYWDIYWDLHLGVKGEAIPPHVRTIGESFVTVLAFRDPTQPIVYENYMTVRHSSTRSRSGSTSGSMTSLREGSPIRKRRSPGIGCRMPAMESISTRKTSSSNASTISSL